MKTAEIEPPKPVPQNSAGYRVEACESEAVRKIEQSIAYMTQHLDEPLQVATLAARANISPSHFFALFKRQTGCAPIDCFIRLRMQEACRLLDETMLSVKEVAAMLGYDDPFYFSRIFKSVIHVAPSEYRLLKNGAKEEVRNSGARITLRFSHPRESNKGLECTPAPAPGGAKGRTGISSVGKSGCKNGEW